MRESMTEHKGVGSMMPSGDYDATYGVEYDVADGVGGLQLRMCHVLLFNGSNMVVRR